ncbi:ankyrin repeat domain-containing protein [Plakobranchus ocellatus]|uniref:Ankyrin repeat domain-containing protein n=1 Tax=Plakobranchus ocellatus TaxID=259542 RepID=A0AAV3Y8U0_9GAST|nr:ankyrin repeat domain-containing protein [Plakobranchus ocellatus]
MSEKKSPPHKDKTQLSKPLLTDGKANKRKLATPASPTDDDEKKNQQKRKRFSHHGGGMMTEGSPEHTSLGSPRGAGGATVSKFSVPYSERQQMAILMRMQDESSLGDASPKSPSSGPQVSSSKRTPADKKVNKRNERGEAPLHMAAKKGDYKQTKRLLKAGASVNMKDYAGWTALHEACNSGNLRVARHLLKAGADVNVQGFDDDTPLHDASSNGHKKLVQLLLRNGADPHQPNLKGKTAVKVAATAEIEAILRNNSHGLGRDSDLDESAESSSDSNLSSKDEERSACDDELKTQSKPDTLSSAASSAFISSSSGPTRRPSVPPSPDKMAAASPRLYLKLQHKKSSSSSSSAADEQQRVLEWNVLTVEGHPEIPPPSSSSEVDSDATATTNMTNNTSVRVIQHSLSPLFGSSKREDCGTWARVRGEAGQGNSCPDSTVSATASLPASSLTRTRTEPFTPRGSEFPSLATSNTSNEEEGQGDVFTNASSSGDSFGPSFSSSNGKQYHHHATPSSVTSLNTSFCSTLPAASTVGESLNNKHLPPMLTLSSSSNSSSSSFQQPVQSSTNLQQHVHTLHSQQHYSPARSPQQSYHIQQHQPQKHAIPTSSQTYSSYQGARGAVQTSSSSTFTNMQQSAVSSSFAPSSLPSIPVAASISSSLSSSSSSVLPFPSSSPHGGSLALSSSSSSSTCQFSTVSSSVPASTSLSLVGTQSTGATSSTTTSAPSSTTCQPGSGGDVRTPSGLSSFSVRSSGPPKGGGGSIVTGLSDRAVAASSGSTGQGSVWDGTAIVLPSDDRSDTSSCDSPLRVDTENHSNGGGTGGGAGGSRPSTPKVPPLKIIMPPKQGSGTTGPTSTSGGVSSNKGNKLTQAKPALPYVLNPSSNPASTSQGDIADSGEHNVTSELGDTGVDGGSVAYFSSIGGSSRPSSRAGSGIGAGVSSSTKLLDGGAEEMSASNLDLDDGASRDEGSDSRAENTDGSGGKSDEGKRPTRTLRSHTAMLQQAQAKQEPKDKPQEKEKNGGGSVTQEEGDNSSTTRSQKGDDSVADDSNVPHRKRKLRTKTELQTIQTAAAAANTKLAQTLEKPPNPYETYLNLRRQIASRHRTLYNVAPKAPSGFKDFLMVNCTYVLQGNATSTMSVPVLPPPSFVPAPMKEFFNQQEKERYRLRLQHLIEREKLMLSIEQEILREHGRAARAMANQRLPFSVCTILREEEIYNMQELEQVEDREKNVRSRYNGRQFISWLQAVDDKYEKIKQLLLLRHHHEAESLCAVQKLDWEWKLKECGLCDHKNTPAIDDLQVPMVNVSNEFELLPTS